MTLADLWKYIKGDKIILVEPDGKQIEHYNNHKYMFRFVEKITSINNSTFIYLV
jgi:hypothetical protein